MSFANLGFCYFQAALVDEIDELETLLDQVEQGGPGTRITDFAGLACFLDAKDVFGSILAAIDAHGARPVRAILFDKRADQNWALGWHQDRTICVREEIETEGFGPFSKKQGLVHVEPPFEVIERMITLRIHLDPVPEENAPLLVAEGSHRLARFLCLRSTPLPHRCQRAPALQIAAIYGLTRHRFSMRPSVQPPAVAGEFCRSTTHRMSCRPRFNGSAFTN
ncbi:phytanoyl-CoA dioxygenase family protein [Qipengyuania citrea]|uniref:Phytanoyl-CoA dioxygenase family protein n=1 Tax=Qipengyuania citrea TaxID=225971 RepID=A0ABY4U5F7_9SPHN|nr:phytanoyl-CoA dioxygenase family protein [Qipengyuania citrea]USA61345.1 phytanoyl-CoA dioxygenase family protein [Qipengyuania citrea]